MAVIGALVSPGVSTHEPSGASTFEGACANTCKYLDWSQQINLNLLSGPGGMPMENEEDDDVQNIYVEDEEDLVPGVDVQTQRGESDLLA